MKYFVWTLWGLITLALAGYYGYTLMFSDDKSDLLIGDTTWGHYQIEMACESCHTSSFGGKEVLQNACVNCHGEELKLANDSHPKTKFTNPRNADRVAVLDARYCVTCHTEHKRESTLAMGLTLPGDFCFRCHQSIGTDRPSHAGMGFDTCASSGCHNFHDNRALYEDFLLEHAKEPWLLPQPLVAMLAHAVANNEKAPKALSRTDIDAPADKVNQQAVDEWLASAHSRAGVNCADCHTDKKNAPASTAVWIEKPGLQQCRGCHADQAKSFAEGKHGMRLSAELSHPLSAVTPQQSQQLPFNRDALQVQQGCNTCHGAHNYDIEHASVDACLSCHSDSHSLAFETSPHAKLWHKQITGESSAGSGVSCATCHLPRETHIQNGQTLVHVQHNQNMNLRPNEKMIRSVCMNCHGLGFSIDALADPLLIENNFNGEPSKHIQSIDMALKRAQTAEEVSH